MVMGTGQTAISVVGLRKVFGEKVVLDMIDLEVARGTVFSLLGPNGAGKTTAVRILSTLIRADGGEARVAGCDPVRNPDGVRRAIGVTGQYSAVDGLLTGRENLILMADLHHLGKAAGRRSRRSATSARVTCGPFSMNVVRTRPAPAGTRSACSR
ncbi:ATP-binding cassette domain-containing protein [Actinomadura latina]|uniref:ATP-binding cassette domain-containing protein n=1 Tax=Actinomadura latina TaxID=163603 RepID=A0A846YVN2_9ACTN|nr:ATP-binding cassette domain-containing protein [Actinomadura latina]